MDWVELHNVEFGDCTVLGGNGQMLMIDCGSLNSTLGKGVCKFEEYAKRLTKRYAPIEQRHGMISHFHKDHVNGFSAILQEEPLFFQRIYLPPAPQDNNGNPAACAVCPVRKVSLFYVKVTNFNWTTSLMRYYGQSKRNIRIQNLFMK